MTFEEVAKQKTTVKLADGVHKWFELPYLTYEELYTMLLKQKENNKQ